MAQDRTRQQPQLRPLAVAASNATDTITKVQNQAQLLHLLLSLLQAFMMQYLFPLLSCSYAVPTTYVRGVAVVSRRQVAAAAAVGAV